MDVITSSVTRTPIIQKAKDSPIEKLKLSKDESKPSGFKRSKTMGKATPLLENKKNKEVKEGMEVQIHEIPSTPVKPKKDDKKPLNTTSKKDKKKEQNNTKNVTFNKNLIEYVDISKRNSQSHHSVAQILPKKNSSNQSNLKSSNDDKLSNKKNSRDKSPQHSCCCIIF